MKKHLLVIGLFIISTSSTLVSCADDEGFGFVQNQSQNSILTLSFSGENIQTYQQLMIETFEVNTGVRNTTTIENANAYSLELPQGSYKITVNGTVLTRTNELLSIAGNATVDLLHTVENLTIPLYAKQFSDDFILEEIFYTGTKTPEGKAYNNGKYFKITNNTSEVLYADGLLILQSEFITSVDNNVSPLNKNEYLPVKGMMELPGSGTDYPVQPGDFIVVADNAINHQSINSNAFDLHNADFEFPNDNPTLGNVDNPAVPNVLMVYTNMNYNMFYFHNAGVEAYALARYPEGVHREGFLENYKYTYSYTNTSGNVMTTNRYKVPNQWIIDAVNNGNDDKLIQLVTGPALDAGYASTGAFYQDPNRFGKTVRRKVLGQTPSGQNVYKDTNNSTVDFVKSSEPSLKNGIVH